MAGSAGQLDTTPMARCDRIDNGVQGVPDLASICITAKEQKQTVEVWEMDSTSAGKKN